MTDLFEQSSQKLDAAITEIQHAIATGLANKQRLFETMRQLYGEGSANGAWSQRDAFDLLEAALTRHMAGLLNKPQMLHQISEISALIEALPTHTVRSEDQIRFQQFSTPADLAALCVILAQPLATDIVLEPSAGHGALVATLPDISALHLNEIDPRRREKLVLLFPQAATTGIDGAMLASHLNAAVQPSLILMNPPFSRSMGRGADEFAAVRHLRAAITRLKQGGRIVAIMPDWFSPSAKYEETFRRTLEGARVVLSLRLDKGGYVKHGTGIAVRVLVIDKVPGEIGVSTINRGSVGELFAALPSVPHRATLRDPAQSTAPRPKLSLFRSVKTGPARPVIVRAPQTNDVRPVAYKVLAEPAAMGEQRGVYADYRPSRVVIAEAGEHPTHLVESAAMASIAAPKPNYVPSLPERTVTARLLYALGDLLPWNWSPLPTSLPEAA